MLEHTCKFKGVIQFNISVKKKAKKRSKRVRIGIPGKRNISTKVEAELNVCEYKRHNFVTDTVAKHKTGDSAANRSFLVQLQHWKFFVSLKDVDRLIQKIRLYSAHPTKSGTRLVYNKSKLSQSLPPTSLPSTSRNNPINHNQNLSILLLCQKCSVCTA